MRVGMFPFRSSCFNTLSITILNRVADSVSPCLTPEMIPNSFVNWLPTFTFDIELVRVSPISFINFFGTSYLIRHSIIFSCSQSQMLGRNLQIYFVTLCCIRNTFRRFVVT